MQFIEKVEEDEYESFVQHHPTKSHFLASHLWGEISKTRGYLPYYLGVKEKGKLIATALLLKKKLPLGYSYFYIPRGFVMDYQNRECLAFFTEHLKQFVKKQKGLYFKIDPDIKLHTINQEAQKIEGENHYELVDAFKELGYRHHPLNLYFESSQPRFTFRVDLKDDLSVIRARYSKTALRFIKKGQHYQVVPFIGTEENVKDFVKLMKMTEQRQNFFSHDAAFYEQFFKIFSKNENVSLLLAKISLKKVIQIVKEDILKEEAKKEQNTVSLEKKKKELAFFEEEKERRQEDEVIVSGYFTVHYGDKSWYLYGANDLDYKMTYANYLLFDYQIQTAKEKGSLIFDEFGTIGDPKSQNPLIGLHEFKKKFGGEYMEFIGEFDYITKPFMAFIFLKLVPIYRSLVRKRLRKKVKNEEV